MSQTHVRPNDSILAEEYAKHGIRLILFDIFNPDKDLDGACVLPFLIHGANIDEIDPKRFDTPEYREHMMLSGYNGPITDVHISDATQSWINNELPHVCDFDISTPIQALRD